MIDTARAIRRNLLAAAFLTAAVGGAGIAWSLHAPLEGAVITSGTVVVEGNVKTVQHQAGGIVGEIAVREGSQVAAGDLLIRLDQTMTRANLDIVLNELTAQRARLARLQALRDGAEIAFPDDLLTARASDPAIRGILEGETKLRQSQLGARREQTEQRLQRMRQLGEQIRGLGEQRKAVAGQLDIVRKELEDLMPLYQSGNIQRSRIKALERELLRNQGLLGDASARIAEAEAKIAETELQISESDHDFIAGIIKELRETETKIAELREKRIAAEDMLKRLDIRAPIGGRVHQLAAHTVGGVIAPADALMTIVPSTGQLVIEIRVAPADIDQLSFGQEARIRFPAFNRQTTGELLGSLIRIAPDLTYDAQGRPPYYAAAVKLRDGELEKLPGLTLMPGMPAEVFVTTGKRTLASYIAKPIRDQMQRAFRER